MAMNTWQITIQLLGGLAIFLFGLEQLTTALKVVAGERMKLLLSKLTTNRFTGVLSGTIVTSIVQSSSVTTVLSVGFITAGLMNLTQSLGVIMGANIGTTITAQIIAFNITKQAMLMVWLGFTLFFFAKHERIKNYGTLIFGLGMIFFGMGIMSEAMSPLRDSPWFISLIAQAENPLIAILIAAGFTALIQSSSATTGIIIILATQGLITLPIGIALSFGANIGTCVTAGIAAIGKPREAVRAALFHILFNIFGVLIWFLLIDELSSWVQQFSPTYAELSGLERQSAEVPRQIANAHTLFNVVNMLIFIGFIGPIVRLLAWLVPDKKSSNSSPLEQDLLATPSLALAATEREIDVMGDHVLSMLQRSMPETLSGNSHSLHTLAAEQIRVRSSLVEITDYLRRLSKQELTEQETTEMMQCLVVINELETIGEIIERGITPNGLMRHRELIRISDPTQQLLISFHQDVTNAARQAMTAFHDHNPEVAQPVIEMKSYVKEFQEHTVHHMLRRLRADEPHRVAAYTLENNLVGHLKQIHTAARRIARHVPNHGEQEES